VRQFNGYSVGPDMLKQVPYCIGKLHAVMDDGDRIDGAEWVQGLIDHFYS